MKKFIVLFSVLLSMQLFAQAPDPPYNPMTAPGASGISTLIHTLYWQNPDGVTYNEVYFSDDSTLVANSDTSARVKNGFPATTFSSYPLSEYGTLTGNTKYFWKVVEYNLNGASESPHWNFKSFVILGFEFNYSFDTDLEGWQIFGPQGLNNWYWSNTTHTLSPPGEVVFRWDPIFMGDSYLISPEFNSNSNSRSRIQFNFFEDWWSDSVVIGCALTSDNGLNWTSVWERIATGNMGPEQVILNVEIPDQFRIGFYYMGNSNNIDFLYIDDVYISALMPLTPSLPPQMLTVNASDTQQKVTLNWTPGWAPGGHYGYALQRRVGLPDSDSSYITIATTDLTQSFEDLNVELNKVYTYRVRSLVMGFNSIYGNEATAYVPAVVPVELISFFSSVVDNDVALNWTTATETNNSGFNVERKQVFSSQSTVGNEEWNSISFVNGNGTTTETKLYSFKDENLSAGKYQYRLKQTDFDGTFEYSNIIEAEILPPLQFSLEQNYPNPFNPSTCIQYSLASKQFVSLKIFNSLGEEVETLVNEYQEAGVHSKLYILNSTLPSGVYYYQLKAGDPSSGSGQSFIQTRKMILLK